MTLRRRGVRKKQQHESGERGGRQFPACPNIPTEGGKHDDDIKIGRKKRGVSVWVPQASTRASKNAWGMTNMWGGEDKTTRLQGSKGGGALTKKSEVATERVEQKKKKKENCMHGGRRETEFKTRGKEGQLVSDQPKTQKGDAQGSAGDYIPTHTSDEGGF